MKRTKRSDGMYYQGVKFLGKEAEAEKVSATA